MADDIPLIDLYRLIARARAFELVLADLWRRGLISGEMHLGTGEEAVAAGVAAHLRPGDAVALDHRPTPMFVMRGVDAGALLREVLGREDGLCRGRGGHMHLFSRDDLLASSGIVGASAPLGAGFALAAQMLRPGGVAVSFFGEGAMNQGMLLETLNLAAAWTLPVVLVCKDNGWAATTESSAVTAGSLLDRAAAFDMPADRVDGLDVGAVARIAGAAVERARHGGGPSFVLATCSRLDGHFLGDPVHRVATRPLTEGRETLARVAAAVLSRGGGGLRQRAAGLAGLTGTLYRASRQGHGRPNDPVRRTRRALANRTAELDAIDAEAADELQAALDAVGVGDVLEAAVAAVDATDDEEAS